MRCKFYHLPYCQKSKTIRNHTHSHPNDLKHVPENWPLSQCNHERLSLSVREKTIMVVRSYDFDVSRKHILSIVRVRSLHEYRSGNDEDKRWRLIETALDTKSHNTVGVKPLRACQAAGIWRRRGEKSYEWPRCQLPTRGRGPAGCVPSFPIFS